MNEVSKTDFYQFWNFEIQTALESSNSFYLAIFSISGELLFANAGMKSLFKDTPKESFINPSFDTMITANSDISRIFNGYLTLGSRNSSKNISIQATVFRREDQLLIVGEIDVNELVMTNNTMFELNREVNDLQRKIIREKQELRRAFEQLKESQKKIVESELKIREVLDEKELILKEVHHRIKNNMNTIYGLLAMQANNLRDLSAKEALADAGNRVQSMMTLYDKLYQSANFTELSVREYLPDLIDHIISNFPNRESVKIEKEIDDFILPIEKLQPLGILINELITNSMKYAFKEKKNGLIYIKLRLIDNSVSMTVSDNGSGMQESIDFNASTGFGLTLIKLLTKQLKGNIRIERVNGTRFFLEFGL